VASPRLRNLRLRRETWERIRSGPKEAEAAPLNARIIMELFSSELRGDPLRESGEAIELTALGVPETTQAMPWSIYRLEKQAENGAVSSELRFENFDPGDKDDPTLYEFVIGSFSQQENAFAPCLRVDAGCNVTIRGTLIVEGELIQSPIKVDPNDPRYVDQLVQSWNQGEGAAKAASDSLEAELKNLTAFANAISWSYEITITNKSKTTITNLLVLDTFSVGGKISPTLQREQLASLAPEEISDPIRVNHNSPLPASGRLYVAVSVQGRLPSGITAYASAQGATDIVDLPI
jgi:hypothetical protein